MPLKHLAGLLDWKGGGRLRHHQAYDATLCFIGLNGRFAHFKGG
jgi:hypothetical protein